MVHDDLIPRLPPRQLGMMAGVSARLILDPANEKRLGRLRYLCDENEAHDGMWGADVPSHTCHALYLGGETTAGRQVSLPPDGTIRWPLLSRTAEEAAADAAADAAAAAAKAEADVERKARVAAVRVPTMQEVMSDSLRHNRRFTAPNAPRFESERKWN